MKKVQNYYRNQTGVAPLLNPDKEDVVKYDTLQRTSSSSSEKVGVLHAGVVKAVKNSTTNR